MLPRLLPPVLRDARGVTALEYAVVAAAMVGGALVAYTALGGKLATLLAIDLS